MEYVKESEGISEIDPGRVAIWNSYLEYIANFSDKCAGRREKKCAGLAIDTVL